MAIVRGSSAGSLEAGLKTGQKGSSAASNSLSSMRFAQSLMGFDGYFPWGLKLLIGPQALWLPLNLQTEAQRVLWGTFQEVRSALLVQTTSLLLAAALGARLVGVTQ